MEKINKKILIVEDDKDILFILETQFTNEGFSVVVAVDGEEGLRAAEKEKPDLIISDILIPKIDGIEMAKKIKESKNTAPIIFLTNLKSDDYADNVKELGEFEYLIKSDLKIEEIVDKVKAKLGLK